MINNDLNPKCVNEVQDAQAPGAESRDNGTAKTQSLTHYNNQHIQVRRDFFELCAYDKAKFNQGLSKNGKKVIDEPNQECMAKILRIFETLIDRNGQAWIRLSYSAIASLLYNTYKESTIRKSIAALIAMGYIQCYQETKASVPRYTLNFQVIQAALDQQRQEYIQKAHFFAPTEAVNFDTQAVNFDTQAVNFDTQRLSILTPNKIEENKIINKINYERMNGTRQQKTNVVDQQGNPSIHPSQSSQKIFSEEKTTTQKEKVVFTEQELNVYKMAVEMHLARLRKDEKNKDYCAKLVEENVMTVEKMKSLAEYSRAQLRAIGKDDTVLYLGNLAGDINGWLQAEEAKRRSASADLFGNKRPSVLVSEEKNQQNLERLRAMRREREAAKAQDNIAHTQETVVEPAPEKVMELPEPVEDVFDEYSVSDDDINEKVQGICMEFQDSEDATMHTSKVWNIKRTFGVSNKDLFEYIIEAYKWAREEDGTVAFFLDKLHGMLARAYQQAG